jgi:hypothetical protein
MASIVPIRIVVAFLVVGSVLSRLVLLPLRPSILGCPTCTLVFRNVGFVESMR